jgi:GNAT superfamily N-acetyltransferase
MSDLTIRRAVAGDEELILTLLVEFAEYEKLTHAFHLTKEIIARDFFGPAPAAFCYVAHKGGKPVGLATWYWIYATFAASRGIFLEDLYVRAEHRGSGYGKALLAHLAKEALANGAIRIEWSVLNWNKPSIDFYERLGAKPNTEWTIYRISDAPLKALARP